MSIYDHPFLSQLTKLQPTSRLNSEEIMELRQRAWTQQGLLVVSPADDQLATNERRSLIQIGERLYGGGDQS